MSKFKKDRKIIILDITKRKKKKRTLLKIQESEKKKGEETNGKH